MNRIDQTFKRLRQQRKKAFIAFVTAGYPSLRTSEQLALELERAGADIVELGVPFSDPIADGPVIQQSSFEALRSGVTVEKVFALVRRLRRRTAVPICLMSYYNPIFVFGQERFLDNARDCGADGIIVCDLPFGEVPEFSRMCARRGIRCISFIAPTTGRQRARTIARQARGFIYYISLAGTTGARAKLPSDLARHLRAIRGFSRTPVCAGFGISTPAQVRRAGALCDGVIVGSAIVSLIRKLRRRRDMPEKVGFFVRQLLKGR